MVVVGSTTSIYLLDVVVPCVFQSHMYIYIYINLYRYVCILLHMYTHPGIKFE